VEERIRSIVLKRQSRKSAISQLEALVQHLCSALEAVYGQRNQLTCASSRAISSKEEFY
jgi:hypothetical protein